MVNQRFDFKGNLLLAERQLTSAYDETIIDWPDSPAASVFEPDVYTQSTEYDALNRIARHEDWHLAGRDPATYAPTYNERGLLAGKTLVVGGQVTQVIARIEYDARSSAPTN